MALLSSAEKKTADMTFGEYFYYLVNKRDVSRPLILTALGISKTYLYDVFKDRVCAPTPDMQIKIASLLGATDKELSVFFDKAAKRRNEIPADISAHLTKSYCTKIREEIDYPALFKQVNANE